MSPLSCSYRCLSDITNSSCPQTHPKGLCGKWTYEYKSPYCPYGNQHVQETYVLLSCGIAYESTIDKYDEGSDYFSERKTSGWGRWFFNSSSELIIACSTMTTSSVGGSVCGDEKPSWSDDEYSSESMLRESWAEFITKYKRQGSLDDIEEDKLRAQMHHAIENLPPKAEPQAVEDSECYSHLPSIARRHARCAPKSCSRSVQKAGTLSSLRQMFARSKRQCS
jgi:hypothetical protein